MILSHRVCRCSDGGQAKGLPPPEGSTRTSLSGFILDMDMRGARGLSGPIGFYGLSGNPEASLVLTEAPLSTQENP